ncbi:MAG: DegT/DnrJ/EryC1/StrS family aminotransferase [Thermodesulfovibrionales bacterium]
MIPRHSLPFDARNIFSILLSSAPAMNSQDVEKAYADALGLRRVLLLPSVRAGTHMAILAAGGPGLAVTGPAYTCHTMHEALALSGASIQLVDSAPGSFLMPPEGISAASEPGSVLVLSEVYGIPYDREMLQKACEKGPRMRVFDMAMSIPSLERLGQLEARDVALFSFGWGKPMFAGWGGIACFQDPALADRVREIRDRWTIQESSGLRFRRGYSTLLRVAANQRYIYGLSHERHLYRLYKNMTSSRCEQAPSSSGDNAPAHFRNLGTPSYLKRGKGELISPPLPVLSKAEGKGGYSIFCSPPLRGGDEGEGEPCAAGSSSDMTARTLPAEWTRPMTGLNRALAMHNLRNSTHNAELRRLQAEIYHNNLVEPGIARGPGSNTLPQSHFPIRIPSGIRDAVCDYLRGRGIDTSTLFSLPAGLGRDRYPNAAEAADEVMTLPLGMSITPDEVRMVSQCVKDGLQALGC